MSEFQDVNDLDALESELQDKLNKLREEKRNREIARMEEEKRNRTIIITARTIYGSVISFELSELRDDVIDRLKKIPGYSYQTTYIKQVALTSWHSVVELEKELPKVEVKITPEMSNKIQEMLTQPNYFVDVNPKGFTIKVGYMGSKYKLQVKIPTLSFDVNKDVYKIPMSDGWRIVDVLKEEDNVVFSEEAKVIIVKQIEERAQIDIIAKAEDSSVIRQKLAAKDAIGKKLSEALRNFQTVDIHFADVTGGRYLNANEMGLGKTLEALAYVHLYDLRAVIICPASLMYNWSREIRKWLDKPCLLMSGSVPTKWDMQTFLVDKPQFIIINYDIISRSQEVKVEYEFGHKTEERFFWIDLINLSKPDIIIVDEAHYIKNVDSNRSRGIRKLNPERLTFLTGTPVLNRPGELWPMLTMLRPDEFPFYETFLKQYTWDGKTARNVEELKEILRPLMIRRKTKDVFKELPPINRINEFYSLGEEDQRIYDKAMAGLFEAAAAFNPGSPGAEKEITNVLVQILRCKQICSNAMAENSADKATQLYDSGTDNGVQHKVMIFSQFKGVAYEIYRRLQDQGALCFVESTGDDFVTVDSQRRDELVQQFQTDPAIKYLIVTEKTTKEGMNITAAQSVIFNDLFWTPANHKQAEGRAYGRVSDMHSINSYYLVFQNTIMEWILELLDFKSSVIEETVEGVEASRETSVQMKLIDKIKSSMWTKGK